MTSQTLADVLRALNVLLAITYLPLLHLRVQDRATDHRLAWGIVLFLIAVISGSWENRDVPLRVATALTTLALLAMISVSVERAVVRWRHRRNPPTTE